MINVTNEVIVMTQRTDKQNVKIAKLEHKKSVVNYGQITIDKIPVGFLSEPIKSDGVTGMQAYTIAASKSSVAHNPPRI